MKRKLCQKSFINFIRAIAPWFIIEEIHLLIAEALEQVADGKIDRLMIFMPPRAGKSQLLSIFFPAWYLGRFPDQKVMQCSYKAELAIGFGRQVRDMLKDPDYQTIFPGVGLRPDVKASGRWMTEHDIIDQPNGEYYASGTTGGVAGKGFNLGIIDDPLSEQDAASQVVKDYIWNDWYGPGFYTRRQPDKNAIVVISTRWALDDLAGHLLEAAKNSDDPFCDQWHVIKIPAEIDAESAKTLNQFSRQARRFDQRAENLRARTGNRAPFRKPLHRFREGDSFAPRRFSKRELRRSRANMANRHWVALYQQEPVEDSGNILKREDWRRWKDGPLPSCQMIICCYDTAYEEDQENDYSARTTWGVFVMGGRYNVILLERWKDRVTFPKLRKSVIRHYQEYEPDLILVEKRSSGISLIQELKRTNLPVRPWLPPGELLGTKARGKVPRAHAASVILEQGCVWYVDRRWAEEVIDECAIFPFGEHDDLTDTVTMALLWLRRSFKLEFVDEMLDDDAEQQNSRRHYGG